MRDRARDEHPEREAYQCRRRVEVEAQPGDRCRLEVDRTAQQRCEFEQRAAVALADQGASPRSSA
jgi:hypothetical protein